jgi:hypothetical protein
MQATALTSQTRVDQRMMQYSHMVLMTEAASEIGTKRFRGVCIASYLVD